MTVYIVDRESEYLEKLSERLSALIPGLKLAKCQSEADLGEALNRSDAVRLFIYNKVEFGRFLESRISAPDVRTACWPLVCCPNGFAGSDEKQVFNRLGSVRPLVGQLQKWLMACPGPAEPDGSMVVSAAYENGLHLLLNVASSRCQPAYSRQLLKKMMISCDRVLYLPLMPTYMMQCAAPPDSGPAMSDLLMRLTAAEISPGQLGMYLQPHPEGYLQFRPPDRADDLPCCCPDNLRALVHLIRAYIEGLCMKTTVLIDCWGLPLTTVTAVGVLCDRCEVLYPETADYAAQCARSEIGRLLSELPAGCQVIRTSLSCIAG